MMIREWKRFVVCVSFLLIGGAAAPSQLSSVRSQDAGSSQLGQDPSSEHPGEPLQIRLVEGGSEGNTRVEVDLAVEGSMSLLISDSEYTIGIMGIGPRAPEGAGEHAHEPGQPRNVCRRPTDGAFGTGVGGVLASRRDGAAGAASAPATWRRTTCAKAGCARRFCPACTRARLSLQVESVLASFALPPLVSSYSVEITATVPSNDWDLLHQVTRQSPNGTEVFLILKEPGPGEGELDVVETHRLTVDLGGQNPGGVRVYVGVTEAPESAAEQLAVPARGGLSRHDRSLLPQAPSSAAAIEYDRARREAHAATGVDLEPVRTADETAQPVVNSWNEWDPLEEAIVGVLDGAVALSWDVALEAVTANEHLDRSRQYHMAHGGSPIESLFLASAQRELDQLVGILESEGVTVRRPEPMDHARPIVTPHWTSPGGNCQANPRDVLIVFGNEILEAPMAWRSRYFESFAYRKLCKDYFRQGARWSAAPKPEMSARSYKHDYKRGVDYVTTDYEPMFDVADIMRCGRDVFVQRSHVTNDMGIDWLRRQYGETFTFHRVEFDDYRAIHIDATFVPLAPGKILVNPDRPIRELPAVLRDSDWELRPAPRSTLSGATPLVSLVPVAVDERGQPRREAGDRRGVGDADDRGVEGVGL